MILLLEGPQGSGKGTYAQMLAGKFEVSCFESGRELRRIARGDGVIGNEVKAVLESGGLVSDEEIYFLTEDWLGDVPIGKNMIFDGCPRKMLQAVDVEKLLSARGEKFDLVMELKIDDTMAVERLMNRLVCSGPEEHIFNTKTRPPRQEGVCDFDGQPLARREDETSETIRARLANYHKETELVINYFKKKGLVVEIDGSGPVETVFGEILKRVGSGFGTGKEG